jgi:hypothetical protein
MQMNSTAFDRRTLFLLLGQIVRYLEPLDTASVRFVPVAGPILYALTMLL